MEIFKDVKLTWSGQEYKIPGNRVMGLILRIESVITLSELASMGAKAQSDSLIAIPLARISQAYSEALQYAGANISTEEVYAGMFAEDGNSNTIVAALIGLQQLMLPPSIMNGVKQPDLTLKKIPKKKKRSSLSNLPTGAQ
jgi:hypothetical protein